MHYFAPLKTQNVCKMSSDYIFKGVAVFLQFVVFETNFIGYVEIYEILAMAKWRSFNVDELPTLANFSEL